MEARGQLLADAETQIKDASLLPTEGFSLWIETVLLGRRLNERASHFLDQAGEDLQNAFEATRYIADAQNNLGEKQAAIRAAQQLVDWWQHHAVTARKPARLILAKPNSPLPEQVWSSEAVARMIFRIKDLENDGALEVEFQVDRKELLND